MELIGETIINKRLVRYYKGLDIESILDHPKDGSEGMMIVFFNSIKEEETRHTRNELIQNLLESKEIRSFSDILEKIDNCYLALYETHGYTDVIYKSIKCKLEVVIDYNFAPSESLWATH